MISTGFVRQRHVIRHAKQSAFSLAPAAFIFRRLRSPWFQSQLSSSKCYLFTPFSVLSFDLKIKAKSRLTFVRILVDEHSILIHASQVSENILIATLPDIVQHTVLHKACLCAAPTDFPRDLYPWWKILGCPGPWTSPFPPDPDPTALFSRPCRPCCPVIDLYKF